MNWIADNQSKNAPAALFWVIIAAMTGLSQFIQQQLRSFIFYVTF